MPRPAYNRTHLSVRQRQPAFVMKKMLLIRTQARTYILAEVKKAPGDFKAGSIVTSAKAAAAARQRRIHFVSARPVSVRACEPNPIKTEQYSIGISAQTMDGVWSTGPVKARTSPAATIIITLMRWTARYIKRPIKPMTSGTW